MNLSFTLGKSIGSLSLLVFSLFIAMTASHADDSRYEEVKVTGKKETSDRERFRTGQSGVSLEGDELRLQVSNTLGESLVNLPGIHNASFGPSVGLPVLRGLSGVRVRIIEDDIGSWDASSLSPDHAIAIEPVLAERIEVLRGASTIEYGNAAVGGVVAVDTQRIPLSKTGNPLSGSVELRKELFNEHYQETTAAKVNAETESLGIHVDGFKRSHDNVSIPGCAIDVEKVFEQYGFDASDSNTCGYIANSDSDADGFSLGTAITKEKWYLGTSYREVNNNYGIPPGSHNHNHGDDLGEPLVRIDLEQRRFDVSAGYIPKSDYLTRVELLIAKSDYEHLEAENALSGTTFVNDVTEAKFRLEHSLSENIEGVAGIQVIDRYFAATGEENFIPPADVEAYGVFLLEKFNSGNWTYQAGMRFDRVEITQLEPASLIVGETQARFYSPIDYKTGSFQLAASYTASDRHALSVSLGRHQRVPDIHELLAYGAHLATNSYDVGLLITLDNDDPRPEAELYHSLDVNWTWQNGWGHSNLQVFYSDVSDFIYQSNSGFFFDLDAEIPRGNCVRLEECLPIYNYNQSDAILHGYEWQWRFPVQAFVGGELQFELFTDYVKGRLTTKPEDQLTLNQDSYKAIPRMPPRRYGVVVHWVHSDWLVDLRWTRLGKQDKPGAFETTTSDYMRVDASVHYVIPGTGGSGTVFLKGKNLTDEVIRSSTSFIRNFAPEPGRSIEFGLRWAW